MVKYAIHKIVTNCQCDIRWMAGWKNGHMDRQKTDRYSYSIKFSDCSTW